nr:hypothetical protein [Candidatus Sigynarchaeota archaeon]
MKYTKHVAATSIIVALALVCAIRAVSATPTWLPASTNISGYTLQWESETEFTDFTNVDQNTTMYTQLWLKNDTVANFTNLLAAAMLDMGGSLFLRSPQLSGIAGTLIEPTLAAMLNMTQVEYDALTTVWDVLVIFLTAVFASSNYVLNQTTVSNLDKALLITDTDVSPFFDYLLFGIRGDRVILVFAFSVQTQILTWLNDIAGNNASLYTTFESWFIYPAVGFMSLFVAFASIFQSAGSSMAASASPVSISTASIEPLATTQQLNEVTAFASGIGQLATVAAVPGYDGIIVMVAAAVTTGLLLGKFKGKKE